jgi:transcriptional regulator with XRE-family HTH domain
MTKEHLAKTVRALREQRQWSQERLAREAGISTGYVARLEKGQHDPSLSTIENLARALKTSVGQLIGEKRSR